MQIMKTKMWAAILFAGGILIGAGSSELIHAQAPSLASKLVFQTDLNNIPGQELLLYASTWQPGYRLPLHMHPEGHELTYVVEGEQTFEIEGVGTKIVKAGEAIYTPPNTPAFRPQRHRQGIQDHRDPDQGEGSAGGGGGEAVGR
jgi:mannose-6-phosphate isomerase-like protein (cupin superfamily)